METGKLPPLLLLHPDDNILVARRDIAAGERVEIDGEASPCPAAIELGHKARAARPCGGYSRPQVRSPHRLHEDCGGARRARAPAQPAQRLPALDVTRMERRTDSDERPGKDEPLDAKDLPAQDGRKGIRNVVAVAYLVECAHHVSRLIVQQIRRATTCTSSASPAAIRTSMRSR